MQSSRKPSGLPSRRLVLGGSVAAVLFIFFFSAVMLWPEERLDVSIVQSDVGESLLNETKAVSLGRGLVLRNLMLGLSKLGEEYKTWHAKSQETQAEQYGELQKRLIDLKASGADHFGDLKAQLGQAVKGLQEEQSRALEELRRKVDGSVGGALEELRRKVDGSVGGALEAQRKELEGQKAAMQAQGAQLERIRRTISQQEAVWEYSRGAASREKNFTENTVTEDSLELWSQRTFQPYGAYGFIRYSAYRVSRSRIAVLGLAARAQHQSRRLTWCKWNALDGSVLKGTLSMLYAGEHHNYMYEVVILNCDLAEDLKEGGGHLTAKLDSEIMYLYKESRAQPLDEHQGPFDYALAYCSPPVFGAMDARAVEEFLEYHSVYMGADHFVLYDAGGVSPDILAMMRRYLAAGVVSVTDFRAANMWEVWLKGQVLAANDCAYRMRERASWVFMQELDEYFEVVPPRTTQQLLQAYHDRAWLTTGCLVFSIHHCLWPDKAGDNSNSDGDSSSSSVSSSSSSSIGSSSGDELLVARMVYRWPHIYCQTANETDPAHCIGQPGHRKYIVNPQKVSVLHVYDVGESTGEGLHLGVGEARHLHFEGLGRRPQLLCEKEPPASWWLQYDGIARISQAVKACAKDPKTKLCKPGSVEGLEALKARKVEEVGETSDKKGR